MKKGCLLLALISIIFFCDVNAATVTVQDAQTIAVNYYKVNLPNLNPRITITAALTYTQTETDNTVDFYVFNMNPGRGFVIVSATDNVIPVLAWSTESNFKANFNRTGVVNWVNKVSAIIHYVVQTSVQADTRITNLWAAYRQGQQPFELKSTTVGPLCTTIWDQENDYSNPPPYLYNLLCPYNSTNKEYTYTGCVATAMAQIMKYWNYPAQGTGSHSFSCVSTVDQYNYGTLSADFGTTTYDWTNMPDSLKTGSSATDLKQDSAVDLLMYQCGVSVNMDYGDSVEGGSGAPVLQSDAGGANKPCAQNAFKTYFGYNPNTLQGVQESSYSATAWTNLIENELNAGRVVEYEGVDPTYGGHSWVCDGYDVSNNLHMNWGWSGLDDGYFAISDLAPALTGFDFSENDAALIGIEPAVILHVEAGAQTSAICPGTPTTLTATGPALASYAWSPTTGLSCSTCASSTATPTATTVYTVTVDSAGYTATASATITVRPAISISPGNITDPGCYGGANGSASISASGGTPSLSYLWSNSQTTATATNLGAGTFTVTVTDGAGCTATASETLSEPAKITITTLETDATCNSANGGASATVSGGTSAYTYLWSTASTATAISNVAAGTYTLTVTDHNHCTASASVEVTSAGSFTFTSSATQVSCYGGSTGSITLDVSGASGITYLWSNHATSAGISNVAAGDYTVTITDGNGCSASASNTITQPSALTATVNANNAGCGVSSTGSASVSVSGGTGGYSYLWSNNETSASIANLAAGTYNLTVTDAHQCTVTASAHISNSGSLGVTSQITNVRCYGTATGSASVTVSGATGNLTYAWSNHATSASINNVVAGSYAFTVTDAQGCSLTTTETITQPNALNLSTFPTASTCGLSNGSASLAVNGGSPGYTYSWSNGADSSSINNLSAGNYSVTVTDANNCTSTALLSISNNGSALITSNSTRPVTCFGGSNGSATLSITNGTAPYSYSWSNGATSASVSDLAAGSYSVSVSDANHCTASTNVSVAQPNAIILELSTTNCSGGENNGSIAVANVNGAVLPYTYEWSNGATTPGISGLAAGAYTLTLTDANGCRQTASDAVNVATGLDNISDDLSFSLYPNPAANEVLLRVTGLNTETTLYLKNVLGQTLLTRILSNPQTQLNLSSFANGVYMVELRQEEKMAVKELVLSK